MTSLPLRRCGQRHSSISCPACVALDFIETSDNAVHVAARMAEAEADLDKASGYLRAANASVVRRDERVKELESALYNLLLLVEHETGLPESAANGVTDPTGSLDEGVVRAFQILDAAAILLRGMRSK